MVALLQLAPGQVVGGDFEVVELLRAGGMGAVYVAVQKSTGKRRAVKVMHPALIANEKMRERFVREARVGAMIDSDHVVEVIGAGIDDEYGVPWIAMELLDGDDLGEFVLSRGCLTPSELMTLLDGLCHALGAAHDAGVVHRDIKPENVFMARSKSVSALTAVKVLDFGIAKFTSHTTHTATVGSPAWMAPEQTDPKAPITPATDIWAIGLMAFWLLTGKPFWIAARDEDASVHALMREILFDEIPTASARAGEIGRGDRLPDGFDGWFARCVAREPDDRFESTQALLQGFESLLKGVPLARPSDSGSRPVRHGVTMGFGSRADADQARADSRDSMSDDAPEATKSGAQTTRALPSAPASFSRTSAPIVAVSDSDEVDTPTGPQRFRRPVGVALAGLAAVLAVAYWTREEPAGAEIIVSDRDVPVDATGETAPPAPSSVSLPEPTAMATPSGVPSAVPSAAPVASGSPPGPAIPSARAAKLPVTPKMGRIPILGVPPRASAAPTATAKAAPKPSAEPVVGSPAPSAPSPHPHRAFMPSAAHNAVSARVMAAQSQCRAQPGSAQIRVKVTFKHDGSVGGVQVSGAQGASDRRAFCVQRHFWAARIPPYDGPGGTVTTVVGF